MPGKQISKANRERIISAYFTGTKQRVISVQLNIPKSTVCDIVKKYKETGSTEPKQRDVTDKFNTSLDTTFHYNTVRRYLHDEGFGSYSAKKKPRLTEKHRTDRLKWYGRARVWRSPRETYNKDCIQSSVKFGGGSVIFWGVSVGMGLTFDRDGREYGF
ncbi:unnamed protein product [Rhizophagus irregularis]|nr:unnamed protein product [Rhizophagus irregularis]